jgi:hypothetical protein
MLVRQKDEIALFGLWKKLKCYHSVFFSRTGMKASWHKNWLCVTCHGIVIQKWAVVGVSFNNWIQANQEYRLVRRPYAKSHLCSVCIPTAQPVTGRWVAACLQLDPRPSFFVYSSVFFTQYSKGAVPYIYVTTFTFGLIFPYVKGTGVRAKHIVETALCIQPFI